MPILTRNSIKISIHAPAKGATMEKQIPLLMKKFQSTLPRRERQNGSVFWVRNGRFQSTLPRRERLYPVTRHHISAYFNPRSREGSDKTDWLIGVATEISIHAPAKGATHPNLKEFSSWCISIHAPAKGATFSAQSCLLFLLISIHAPAKGATSSFPVICISALFQSTLPRRERLLHLCIYLLMFYFNPRSREGSDMFCVLMLHHTLYFNPRSREGSDLSVSILAFVCGIFQSTLPRRERQCLIDKQKRLSEISIHAPAKGATLLVTSSNPAARKFQSTLPRRERRHINNFYPFTCNFNPRSREGSDSNISQNNKFIL